MASAIPGCKAAILTVLTARAALTGITLSWSGPTKDEDYHEEMVFLGDIEDTSDWAELGTGRRVEDFTVEITVWVERWGDDPQATEERAHALWDEVEDAIRDDIRAAPSTLRTAGVLDFGQITRRVVTGPSTPEKWGARIEAIASFRARNI